MIMIFNLDFISISSLSGFEHWGEFNSMDKMIAKLEELRKIAEMANITFIRQKEAKGLGHAVLLAKEFVGNEPFAVIYGDDMIEADKPTTKSLIEIYEKYGKGVVGIKEVSPDVISKYCSLKVDKVDDRIYSCTDMIEKPTPDKVMSYFSILGRVVLPPEIFHLLETSELGYGGEIQLTDSMATLAREVGLMAYEFPGIHHDMGSKLGLIKANISFGIKHPEISEDLKIWLKNFVKTL